MRRFGLTTWMMAGLCFAACGGDKETPADTNEVTPDVEVSPDVEAEVEAEVETAVEVEAEVEAEVETEVEEEVVLPGELKIAKGDRCNALTEIADPTLPFVDGGDTTGATDDYIYSTGAACGGPAGQGLWGDASPDLVYAFTPELTATYQIEVTPSGDFDPGVMVTDACPPIGEDAFDALTCLGVSDQGEGTAELLRVDLQAGRTYYLLVDGWSNDTPVTGAFNLSVIIGEDCDDTVDNDGNALVDCADPQCASDARCDESLYDDGCANGGDDDSDGKTDCADSDCDGSDACDESTVSCDNKIDDEGDGKTDCADPDCAQAANCDEALYEAGCSNGTDDDGDGFADCDDADCGREAACLVRGETCETAVELSLDVPTQGTTTGRTSDYGTSRTTCNIATSVSDSYGAAAPDAAFTFTAPTTGKYLFVSESTFDDALTVTNDCTFGGNFCYGMERAATGGERIVVDLAAGDTVFVIVDGWSNSSASNTGDFVLTARRATGATAELACGDTVDNDGDGDADCTDSDCAFDRGSCVESGNCDDTIDNDGDDAIDCDDSDCRSDIVACPPPRGDNCADPEFVDVLASVVAIDTCDMGVDYVFAAAGGCAVPTFESPDAVLGFTAPAAGNYVAEVSSDAMYSILNLVVADQCPGGAVNTCDASDDAFDTQKVSFELAAGEKVWLLVSAYGDDWFEEPGCGPATVAVYEVDAEVCTDELDNDRDDLVDCDDADCVDAINCNERLAGASACGDNIDNDNDSATDCFDNNCAGSTQCPNGIPGDTCASAYQATGETWSVDVQTCFDSPNFTFTETNNCQSTSGTPRDVVATYLVPTTGDYSISFTTGIDGASTYDALLNIVKATDCPGATVDTCLAGSDLGNPERATVAATAGERLWVIAGGWAGGCGLSRLSIALVGPEICGDGIDNNANGRTDCADSDCVAFAECIEVCDDKKDNDVDGTTDCADSDCDSAIACNESLNGAAACRDGNDNDNDLMVDCFDADCATSADCPNGATGDNCNSAPRITTATWTNTFSTCDYANNFAQSSGTGCTTMGTAGDIILQYVAPSAGNYTASMTSGINGTSTFDSVLNVVKADTCPGATIAACADGADDGASSSAVERVAFTATAAGETFWILGDGYSSGCGTVRVDITRLEDEVCDDEVDNDGDGKVDCADDDCRRDEPDLCPVPDGDLCGDSSIAITTLPYTNEASTCGFAQDYDSDGDCAYHGGPELFYRYTATTAVSLEATMVALDVDDNDMILNAMTTCEPIGGTFSQCLAESDSGSDGEPERVVVDLQAGETIYFMGGQYFSDDACVPYRFELHVAP